MEKNYKSLLDKVYELEGLLSLALSRDEVPSRLAQMIDEKISEVGEFESKAEEIIVNETAPLPSEEELQINVAGSPTENSESEKDDSKTQDLQNGAVPPPFPIPLEDTADSLINGQAEVEDSDAVISAEENEETEESTDVAGWEAYEIEDEPGDDLAEEAETERDIKRELPSFTLNDRYLYIRTLFNGDGGAFKKAIRQLASFDSYEEAEEYFEDELGFDMENPEALKFMDYILKYFE